jgi:hypothetical protein
MSHTQYIDQLITEYGSSNGGIITDIIEGLRPDTLEEARVSIRNILGDHNQEVGYNEDVPHDDVEYNAEILGMLSNMLHTVAPLPPLLTTLRIPSDPQIELFRSAFIGQCGIRSCISCQTIGQMLDSVKKQTISDHYDDVVLDLIDMGARVFNRQPNDVVPHMHICPICVGGTLVRIPSLCTTSAYHTFRQKYGADMATQAECLIAGRMTCLALDYQPHMLHAARELLTSRKIVMTDVAEIGVSLYDLQEFLPPSDDLDREIRVAESIATLVTIVPYDKTCVICMEKLTATKTCPIPELSNTSAAGECDLDEHDECTYTFSDKTPVKSTCVHIFHYGCIVEWFKSNTQCPVCRSDPVL